MNAASALADLLCCIDLWTHPSLARGAQSASLPLPACFLPSSLRCDELEQGVSERSDNKSDRPADSCNLAFSSSPPITVLRNRAFGLTCISFPISLYYASGLASESSSDILSPGEDVLPSGDCPLLFCLGSNDTVFVLENAGDADAGYVLFSTGFSTL